VGTAGALHRRDARRLQAAAQIDLKTSARTMCAPILLACGDTDRNRKGIRR
jgi:hypothetical protein